MKCLITEILAISMTARSSVSLPAIKSMISTELSFTQVLQEMQSREIFKSLLPWRTQCGLTPF